ncbi:50S ribosomal protein L22 [Candidatus Woesearchaeota archaeon]|nr:50S ribosomal protein L22 [Candidatus Woesearchaeota archaeon]
MNKYAFTAWNEHMAKAKGASLPISSKMAFEICAQLRGKEVAKAQEMLRQIAHLEKPLPLRRFHKDRGHKAKVGPGAYPVNAAREIGRLLETAAANAQSQGLGEHLVIRHICANRAAKQMHYGRFYGREMKRTHVEVVLEEAEEIPPQKEKQQEKRRAQPAERKKS